MFCSIVYRAGPSMVSSKTSAEQADQFNPRGKKGCSANSHLLFWNNWQLGPYTINFRMINLTQFEESTVEIARKYEQNKCLYFGNICNSNTECFLVIVK